MISVSDDDDWERIFDEVVYRKFSLEYVIAVKIELNEGEEVTLELSNLVNDKNYHMYQTKLERYMKNIGDRLSAIKVKVDFTKVRHDVELEIDNFFKKVNL